MILQVVVKPNARCALLEPPAPGAADGAWRAHLKSPPTEGRANAELIELVADYFHCPKSAVTIRRGARSRHKLVCVALD